MRKYTGFILAAVLFLLACLCAAAGIYKVNQKINLLSGAVETLERQSEMAASWNVRQDLIPDLDPYRESAWKVTQFGDITESQEMCYTVTTENGLVIIDGGCPYEAARLKKIIAQYGNRVEAWILTHPHSDHITAFMDIYDEMKDTISIHHIYLPEHPDAEIMKAKASWDSYDCYERFLSMDIPNLEYVHTGDVLDVMGLKMEVLSAYDNVVFEASDDLMNDGSLVFRLCGKETSMLFLADMGKSMTSFLSGTYGTKLASDYVQMGHHGFGGPDAEVYRLIAPKGAFFDAPGWLMQSDTERSARPKVQLMQELGCQIYSYYTTPNQIILS
ncbi:MAG: MBL fold metallo-hydrolase [Blautia sp.]|nr:MBL fold metallo-hydrolase [Blautia sp.]